MSAPAAPASSAAPKNQARSNLGPPIHPVTTRPLSAAAGRDASGCRELPLWAALLLAALLAGCGGGEGGGGQPTSRVAGYIRPAPYPKLLLEIDVVPGQAPRAASQSSLITGLGNLLAKPGGISADATGVLTSMGAGHAWTFAELDSLARASDDAAVGADTTKIHILFVDGHSADDDGNGKVLGLAWDNRHLVLFKQTIESLCDGAGLPLLRERLCAAAELSVWTHEIGHVIGLVDNGAPMAAPHRDGAHGAHDSSDQCVMYWAYEGQGLFDLLETRVMSGNDNALGFDPACQADINAIRNGP